MTTHEKRALQGIDEHAWREFAQAFTRAWELAALRSHEQTREQLGVADETSRAER